MIPKIITLANNQYIIKTMEGKIPKKVFQSYDTTIAVVEWVGRSGEITLLKGALDISRTTSKYLYKFLSEYSMILPNYLNKRGIEKLISRGDIRTVDEF